MMALHLLNRTKLGRVLSLLGSAHAGERDAAALAAHRMVEGAGLSWAQVLAASPPEMEPLSRPGWYTPPGTEHAADLRFCRQHHDRLTAWERGFVASLAQQRRISARQGDLLAGIAERLRSTGQHPG